MYSWGSDTSDWRRPGRYRFRSDRSPYLDRLGEDSSSRGPRTYNTGLEPNMELVNPRGKTISTHSRNPIIVGVDVTGSMSSWPAEIFDRLPLFYQTLSQYKEDLEICFAAIGDAYCDDYPIQVNNFGKELALEDHLKALYPEGGGGGQISESYELFAYYMLKNCETPNAENPFMFIYGDEKFYNEVDPAQAEHYLGSELPGPLKSKKIWTGLIQQFNLYFLHKPYGHGGERSIDKEVIEHWEKAIGSQRIIELPSRERAVDIALGIVAKHWGHFPDFQDNLSARQDDEAVRRSVYDSLESV